MMIDSEGDKRYAVKRAAWSSLKNEPGLLDCRIASSPISHK
jgi:hypothetical protein